MPAARIYVLFTGHEEFKHDFIYIDTNKSKSLFMFIRVYIYIYKQKSINTNEVNPLSFLNNLLI